MAKSYKIENGRPAISNRGAKDTSDGIRDAIAMLEDKVESISTTLMSTEEFAKTANAASSVQMRLQKGMNNHMARQLALFNMPSKEDFTILAERVMVMDERLVRIEAMLNRIAPETTQEKPPRPPRTRKPKAKSS